MSFVVPAQKTSHIELVDSDGNVGRIIFNEQKFYFQRLDSQGTWEGAEVILDPLLTYTRKTTFIDVISKGEITAGREDA